MEKLQQREEGRYSTSQDEVTPVLVYGPVFFKFTYTSIEPPKLPIDDLVRQIRSETGVNLEEIANSYNSGGLTVTHQGQKIRHEFVCFFQSTPKPSN